MIQIKRQMLHSLRILWNNYQKVAQMNFGHRA